MCKVEYVTFLEKLFNLFIEEHAYVDFFIPNLAISHFRKATSSISIKIRINKVIQLNQGVFASFLMLGSILLHWPKVQGFFNFRTREYPWYTSSLDWRKINHDYNIFGKCVG